MAPIRFPPGTQEEYSGVGYYALAYALGVSLQRGGQADLKSFLRKKIMRQLEIPDAQWDISYGDTYRVDGMTLCALGSGAEYTPRATLRVCELFLNDGRWKGKQLISKPAIDELLARAGCIDSNQQRIVSTNHGWTLNIDGKWPSLPRDAFVGTGRQHQVALVIPSLDLIAVRYGATMGDNDMELHRMLDMLLFAPLIDTIVGPSSRQEPTIP